MKIIITTKNKAKTQAIKEILTPLWPTAEYINEKFESGITEQPMSENEGIQGALNRAQKGHEKYPEADYTIGIEGFVDTNKFGMFLGGCVVIQAQNKKRGIGLSGKVQIPQNIQIKLENGAELGPLMKEKMKDTRNMIREGVGTNGILTQNLYTRVDEFKDATKCALAQFQTPEMYK